ncbi:MAG: InlB B-repeat-containing protein [Acholeplasmatales bacterium]|nr:InlB B-repeat-containing protein [Acholeplasmatales bacterium]
MKRLTKIAAGSFAAIAAFSFAALTTDATATDLTFSYSAYSDTLNTSATSGTAITNVSNGEINGTYVPASQSGYSIPSTYYVSYATSASGVINKIGNSTAAQTSAIPSEYTANLTLDSTYAVGYVCAMKPVEATSITFTINNTKKVAGDTYVLVTSDGSNYVQYGDTLSTASLSLNQTITLEQAQTALSDTTITSFGYAVILTSSGNIYTTTWNTSYVYSADITSTYYDVTFYDSDTTTVLSSSSVEEGTTVTKPSDPIKYGYDFAGWVDENGDAFDFDTTITATTNLYASYTAWDSSIYGDGNTLSLEFIAQLYDLYGASSVNTSSNTALTNTIYTLLQGNTKFQATVMTVGSVGTSTAAINTGGGFSSSNIRNGISITPTTNGTLSMYVYYSSDRTCTMLDSDGNEINAGQSTGAKTMTLIQYELEANKTYNFGGSGSIYIYYATFTNEASACALTVGTTDTSDGTAAMFVGKITGLTDTDTVTSATFVFTGTSSKEYTVTTLYAALTSGGSTFAGAEAADNTYYVYAALNGLTSTYDGKTINVTLTITFSDGSTLVQAFDTYTVSVTA